MPAPTLPPQDLVGVNTKRNDREIRDLARRERKAGVQRGGLSKTRVQVEPNKPPTNVIAFPNLWPDTPAKARRVPRIPSNAENIAAKEADYQRRQKTRVDLDDYYAARDKELAGGKPPKDGKVKVSRNELFPNVFVQPNTARRV